MFFVVIERLSFIDTDMLTSKSKSYGQSVFVSASETMPSVISVISSEYFVARTAKGIILAKPCCTMPSMESFPNCGQQTGIPPWKGSPLL